MVRTTFAGISNPSAFSAQLGSGALLLPRFTLGPSALGSFDLVRPGANAAIADMVARGLAVIVSETPVGDGVHTRVTLMARGFTDEQVLGVDRWQLPLPSWTVVGGVVESRSVGVLGYQ